MQYKIEFLSLAILLLVLPHSLKSQGGLLHYCNQNATYGNVIGCRSPYECDDGFKQCLVPEGGNCSNSWICMANTLCYNSVCQSVYQTNTCNENPAYGAIKTCSAPRTYCRPFYDNSGNLCSYKRGATCNGQFSCEGYYTCRNGKCRRPGLNDYCNPFNGPSCRPGLICHKFWQGCIVPLGGHCNTTIECGGDLLAVCYKNRCRKPFWNNICSPEETKFIPKTECGFGICDADLKRCRMPLNGRCTRHAHCILGAKCRNGSCRYQKVNEPCNENPENGKILKCEDEAICSSSSGNCELEK